MKKVDPGIVDQIETAINEYLTVPEIPASIVNNHAGISPLAMREMLRYFELSKSDFVNLMIPKASDTDAVQKFADIFNVMYGRLTNEFGDNDNYRFREAIVTVHWMQGRTIKRIIEERKKAVPNESIHTTIRTVLNDIETVARFRAPKYISCYNDILKFFLESRGEKALAEEIEDVALYLEMGVNTATQLSLLNLGLSRTSAVEIKEYITSDNLNEQQCIQWFLNSNNNWQSRDLPIIVKKEIQKMLDVHTKVKG